MTVREIAEYHERMSAVERDRDCAAFHASAAHVLSASPRWSHDAECERELNSHGYTPCRCDERSAPPDIPVCGVEHAPGSRVEDCYFCLLKQRDEIAMSRDELFEFVKEIAGLSLLIADNDREFKLIQRARTLVGQPEF